MTRPMPPVHLTGLEGAMDSSRFEVATDLLEWLTSTFIVDGATLENPDHSHLRMASIGVLWTNAPNAARGRTVVGQAEFRPPAGVGAKWARARAECQIIGWFGAPPDFLLTFYADYAAKCSDAEFCALVEHELYHCGQARDGFGAPRFTKAGLPVFELRGHDVEQFTGVVRRYGADAAHVAAFVAAASLTADVPADRIAHACGTCVG